MHCWRYRKFTPFTFGHKLELFLYPLHRVGGSENLGIQQLVLMPTDDWILILALVQCKSILASPNVGAKYTKWSIKICVQLLSIVVTSVPLELSNGDVKGGLVSGVKRSFLGRLWGN